MKALVSTVICLSLVLLVSGCVTVSDGCASLSEDYERAACIEDAAVQAMDSSMCDGITESATPGGSGAPIYSAERCRNRVLFEMAILNGDPSFCDRIDETVMINQGSAHLYNPETGDYGEVTDEDIKAQCYERLP